MKLPVATNSHRVGNQSINPAGLKKRRMKSILIFILRFEILEK
jgi:hypothetical protein